MVSTQLKNVSQIGSFPQVGVKIKNIWNHHLENHEETNHHLVLHIMPFQNPFRILIRKPTTKLPMTKC